MRKKGCCERCPYRAFSVEVMGACNQICLVASRWLVGSRNPRSWHWPIVFVILCFLVPARVSAFIFKWVDEKGTINYSHVPPANPVEWASTELIDETPPGPIAAGLPPREVTDDGTEERDHEAANCPWCNTRYPYDEEEEPTVVLLHGNHNPWFLKRVLSPANRPGGPVRQPDYRNHRQVPETSARPNGARVRLKGDNRRQNNVSARSAPGSAPRASRRSIVAPRGVRLR
jgi:hypothetical protein